jgi:hypothetical protein
MEESPKLINNSLNQIIKQELMLWEKI